MKKKPLISVIINCRNGEKFLRECVKSVLFQSYKNWEIIFFDNKSSDNSLNIIKSFNDPRIKIFVNKNKNFLNLYEARNVAISKSKGEYITFIDVDDISVPPDDVPILTVIELPDELGSSIRKLTRYALPDTVLMACVTSAESRRRRPFPADV